MEDIMAELGVDTLRGADLSLKNLRDANLRGAYLRGAYLSDADLRGANLSDANLRETLGVRYASISVPWHGECGRQILAVGHGDEGCIVHCGCFRGTWEDLDAWIAADDPAHAHSRRQVAAVLRMLYERA